MSSSNSGVETIWSTNIVELYVTTINGTGFPTQSTVWHQADSTSFSSELYKAYSYEAVGLVATTINGTATYTTEADIFFSPAPTTVASQNLNNGATGVKASFAMIVMLLINAVLG